MEIKGSIAFSFVDWEGRISSVFFLPYCNFRCPFCYNGTLVLHPEKEETIPIDQVETGLNQRRGWIDGVCITGGEPTLHSDLPDFCSKLKRLGFPVKVDTNGTNPVIVKELIENGLVDYVALDIKAPLTAEKYSMVTGIDAEKLLGNVKETVETLLRSRVDYEFRTTVVPTLHVQGDIEEICRSIKGCKRYVLQKFAVSLGKETLNPDFNTLQPFADEEMRTFLTVARKILPNTKLR